MAPWLLGASLLQPCRCAATVEQWEDDADLAAARHSGSPKCQACRTPASPQCAGVRDSYFCIRCRNRLSTDSTDAPTSSASRLLSESPQSGRGGRGRLATASLEFFGPSEGPAAAACEEASCIGPADRSPQPPAASGEAQGPLAAASPQGFLRFRADTVQRSAAASAAPSAERPARRRLRKDTVRAVGSEVANRVGNLRRRTFRRATGAQRAARDVPAKAPDGAKPLFEKKLEATVEGIQAALLSKEQCPMSRFLEEVMGFYDIGGTEWKPDPAVVGTWVRKCDCSAPVPSDVPDSIAKILGVPSVLRTTTVYRLQSAVPGEVTLVQQSYTGDVMYGDRFKIEHTISFKEEGGSTVSRQWCRVVWDQPLPWTHSMIRHFIEKRTRADSVRVAGDLVRVLEEAARAAGAEAT